MEDFDNPKPRLEDFREFNEKNEPKPFTDTIRRKFARLLLSWHVTALLRESRLKIINASKSDAKKLELALFWQDRKWHLEQFSYDQNSIMSEIMRRWRVDCLAPEQEREMAQWMRFLRNTTDIRKEAADFLASESVVSIEELAKYDDTKAGAFLFAGQAYRHVKGEDGTQEVKECVNAPDLRLIRDFGAGAKVASDEEWEADGHQVIDYLRSLFPDFEDEEDPFPSEANGGWSCEFGNHAVELMQLVLARGYLDVDLREIVILTGESGNNGKSVFINILEKVFANDVLHERVAENATTTFLSKPQRGDGSSVNKQKGDRADMQGLRFILIRELDSANLDMDFIKPFASREPTTTGGIYKANRKISFQTQVIAGSNHPPRFFERTGGADRRLIVIPFDMDFKNSPLKRRASELEREQQALAHLWRKWIFKGIHKLAQFYGCMLPEDLQPKLEARRQEIVARGKDAVEADLLDFIERAKPGEKVPPILIGGGAKTGLEVGRGRQKFYGLMMVVQLLCVHNGVPPSDWKKDRLLRVLNGKGFKKAGGNRNYFTNIKATPAMSEFLKEHAEEGEDGMAFLYDREGKALAAGKGDVQW